MFQFYVELGQETFQVELGVVSTVILIVDSAVLISSLRFGHVFGFCTHHPTGRNG